MIGFEKMVYILLLQVYCRIVTSSLQFYLHHVLLTVADVLKTERGCVRTLWL
jgi:hypothetical protein